MLRKSSQQEQVSFIQFITELYPAIKKRLISMVNEISREGDSFEKDLNVNILSSNNWPKNLHSSCILSNEISDKLQNIKLDYEKEHQGRKLKWMYQFGTSVIKVNGLDRVYEVECTTYQMSILLIFNDIDELTLQELLEYSRIPKNELIESLKKMDPLIIQDNDLIMFNKKFTSKSTKLKFF